MENEPITPNSVSFMFPYSPGLADHYGLAAQKQYPPVINYLPNNFLTPAPPQAAQVLEEYLAARSILFGGIKVGARTEYRPDLVKTSADAGIWPSLAADEKIARIATSILRAFEALDTVITVSGKANSLRPPLTLKVEDLQIGIPDGYVLDGTYDTETNQIKVDLTSPHTIFSKFADYLNYAVASRTGRTEAASSFKRGWRGLVKEMRQTSVHRYFEMYSTLQNRSLDDARNETQMIGRFFKGYIMHEFLKRGVDIAPAFLPYTLLKRDAHPFRPGEERETQPTLSTGLGREALDIEPYKYEEYEEFGAKFMSLLRAALQV